MFNTTPESQAKLDKLKFAYAEDEQDLHAKWEAFSLRNRDVSLANLADLDKFQEYLERTKPEQKKRPQLKSQLFKSRHLYLKFVESLYGNGDPPDLSENLNLNFSSVQGNKNNNNIVIKSPEISSKPFFMKLNECALILDEYLERFIQRVEEYTKTKVSNPSASSQNEVLIAARISYETSSTDLNSAKLQFHENSSELVLEPSRRVGAGMRVILESKLPEGFYLGQCVALKGVNPSGMSFVANELIKLPLIQPPKLNPKPFRVAILCDPSLDQLESVRSAELDAAFVFAGSNSEVVSLGNMHVITGPADCLNYERCYPTKRDGALSTPTTVNINGLDLAFINADLVNEVTTCDEFSSGSKFSTLLRQMIDMRSYCPYYPLRNNNLEVSRLLACIMNQTPHLLIGLGTETEIINVEGVLGVQICGGDCLILDYTNGFNVYRYAPQNP